jgi:hypothetical protein
MPKRSTQDEEMPANLSGNGQALWITVHEKFELEPHEITMLAEACRAQSRIDELEAIADEDGLIVEGSHGGIHAHPALVEARQQRAVLSRMLTHLHLDDDNRTAGSRRRPGAMSDYEN